MMRDARPDYVLSTAEDMARVRYVVPSKISPWAGGVSQRNGLTPSQCHELRARGIDPARTVWIEGKNWLWVIVPVTDPFEYDRLAYGRLVQHLACPIVRAQGGSFQVLTPKGRAETVHASSCATPPAGPNTERMAS